jgi:hypothetical protein
VLSLVGSLISLSLSQIPRHSRGDEEEESPSKRSSDSEATRPVTSEEEADAGHTSDASDEAEFDL